MLSVFLVALLVGAGLLALVLWLRNRSIRVTWYEWIIGVIGGILVGFAIWHYFGSLAERYATAAWMGLAIFGSVGLVLLVVAWLLAWRRRRASG